MRKQHYVVKLNGKARSRLEDLIRKGKKRQAGFNCGWDSVAADTGKQGSAWNDVQIVEVLGTDPIMCGRARRQFVGEGLDTVLSRKRRATPTTPPIFDGEKEAKLIALACSPLPPGHASWTLRLLESKVVELKIVDHASDNTIGRVLKTYGLLRLQVILSSAPNDQSSSTYPASRSCLEPRWRYARSGLTKLSASKRRFLNQVLGMPFACQATSFYHSQTSLADRRGQAPIGQSLRRHGQSLGGKFFATP